MRIVTTMVRDDN